MAVSNINDKNFIFAPITLNRDVNRGQGTSNIENLERRITRIDREIRARENYIASNNEVISITKQLIAGGERLIKLHQEQKQIILEQKENNNKIIDAAKTLLSRRGVDVSNIPSRSKSTQPVQPSKLEEVNTKTILPKGALISEQKAKLESDVKKHNIAIEYHNNKLDKLSTTDKAKNITATTKPSKKEGLATVYKPTSSIDTLRTDSKPDTVKSSSSYVSNFSSQQQRYIAQSQANIWDSIVSANIRKLI